MRLHVAIMIDDGPSDNTLRLLEILKREGVRATFDLVGVNVKARPDLVRAIVEGGHSICDHSYSHQHPATLDAAALERDIADGAKAIEDAAGKAPERYWPPFLETDPRMGAILARHGMKLCRFPITVRSDDWDASVDAATIHKRVVDGVEDGSIICLHEWRDATVDEMPAIISELRAKGCVFLTYSELEAYLGTLGK